MVKMNGTAAVLQVRDVVKSATFYRDKLGFRCCGLWGDPPCFSILENGASVILLDQARAPGPLPVNQFWAAYVYIDDADACAAELKARGATIARGPEDMEYGCREIDVLDPDGHRICFGQDIPRKPDAPDPRPLS